jgi:hypothetical protein
MTAVEFGRLADAIGNQKSKGGTNETTYRRGARINLTRRHEQQG